MPFPVSIIQAERKMSLPTRIMICSPNNNPELFQYLCQRVFAPQTPQNFSDEHIKGFKIEPVFQSDIKDSNEIRGKASS